MSASAHLPVAPSGPEAWVRSTIAARKRRSGMSAPGPVRTAGLADTPAAGPVTTTCTFSNSFLAAESVACVVGSAGGASPGRTLSAAAWTHTVGPCSTTASGISLSSVLSGRGSRS